MSSLDKDLNKKFGKSNKRLHDAYKAFGLDGNNSTLHGHDVQKGNGYWPAVEKTKKFNKGIDENGKILEHDAANPDLLSEEDSPYKTLLNKKFDILVERMKYLTQREKEVVQLLWEGKTEKETGVILGIEQSTVATILGRIRKKIKSCS